jgi:hypothetical protein
MVFTQYSISGDFSGEVNPDLLHKEIIIDDPVPTAIFEGILVGIDALGNKDTDSLLVVTTNAVPGGEKTALDAVIAAHPQSVPPPDESDDDDGSLFLSGLLLSGI